MKIENKTIKFLCLGGAYSQIPFLKEIKERGYHLILCDYLPNNPGRQFADEYYNISSTDKEAVLKLAQDVKPNFVVAYATDPAAPVAAFVSEILDLPANTYESVRILSEKDKFRNCQRENGFNTPEFVSFTEMNITNETFSLLKFPFIIKPTDSSGSKGISKVTKKEDIDTAVKYAFHFSRNKRIIAEEFIDNNLADLHGDGFILDGKLVFSCLGDHIYNKLSNIYNPIGTIWPSNKPNEIIKKIEDDVEGIIKSSGFKNGPINIEARVNTKGKHYIMEIGPRSGGHFVPQAIQYSTGFDIVKYSLDLMLGKKITISDQPRKCTAYYAIHSDFDGKLLHLTISNKLKPFIKEFHQYVMKGEAVKSFRMANLAIGVIILTTSNRNEMEIILAKIQDYIKLTIEKAKIEKHFGNISKELASFTPDDVRDSLNTSNNC
ncbi:MAG TPA: ATP-grasp domain-containing protein [Paludibacter sp.]|nr:ATP-grasp domain-containing protein [Prolixibacteraceae bacterium]